MATTIYDGGLTTKDASETRQYVFDYDTLGDIASSAELSSVGTFTITPSGLTQANQDLVSGNARKVRLTLAGGTVGVTYVIEHTATTNESPAQTVSKFFKLKIT